MPRSPTVARAAADRRRQAPADVACGGEATAARRRSPPPWRAAAKTARRACAPSPPGRPGDRAGPQTLIEGAQRTRGANHDPGRLAEHVAGGRRAPLGDLAVARRGLAGLANPGVEPDVGDELSRCRKAADVADRGPEGRRRDQVHPRHAHQPPDLGGFERRSRQHPLRLRDLPIEEVDLAQAAGDRLALVVGQRERRKPLPAPDPEDIRHRRPTLEVAGEHRVELVLARVRWRTSAARRARRRRSARVFSSGPKTSGRKPAASSSQSVRASTLSVFTFASAIARSLRVLAITNRPTWGSIRRLIWSAGPVASSATWSSAPRLWANSSSSARLVLIRPAGRTSVRSLIATSQKSRWTSRAIDRM